MKVVRKDSKKNTKAKAGSKSKERKLKQLQEEKRRKALESKSIELLKRYKIHDDAYSLLYSSGTIGQVESKREKHIRAVRFSKAGLDVPKDVKPFKRKYKQEEDTEDAVSMKFYANHCRMEPSCFNNGFQKKEAKSDGYTGIPILGTDGNAVCTSLPHEESCDASPAPELTHHETGTCKLEEQRASLLPRGNDRREATSSQDIEGDGSTINHVKDAIHPSFACDKPVEGPTVIHVSRPSEVEEKRRDLPIVMMEQEIMEAINENSTLIIRGEAGCGKTTQVPQFLYEAGFGSSGCINKQGIIGITQPRRVAVLATAKRVSFELGVQLGKEVGFQVRHDKKIGEKCSIKFMTDGILLREVQSDFLLKQYSIIILDEAHERNLNTDILIGMLSEVVRLRQELYMDQQEKMLAGVKISSEMKITQLKLILMSATLRVEDFVSNGRLFLKRPTIIDIPPREARVAIRFSKRTDTVDYIGQAYKKVLLIHNRLPAGGILVFVTGQREVEYLCKVLRKASQRLCKNNQVEKVSDDTVVPETDMKEISEAFYQSSHNLQYNEFIPDEEEDDDLYASDCEIGDDPLTDDDINDDDDDSEALEKTDSVLDFLSEPKSVASLKAHFEAIAGGALGQCCEEPNPLVNPTKGGCSEKSSDHVGALHVLPLYAMLPASKQLRVFEDIPEGERLVVVATNVAETSLTIPGIKYVVDTGREKVKKYNDENGMATYEVQWISKASAAQRKGRAGRTGFGHCYRLYSAAAFSQMSEFSDAEIAKVPVEGVVLLMKSMGIDEVKNFPFPTPPKTTALSEAERCLKALEALDSRGHITCIGRAMAQYPLGPRHSRMLLSFIQVMRNQQRYARANLVFAYAVAAVVALSSPSPFIMHSGGNHENADDLNQVVEMDGNTNIGQQETKSRKQLKTMVREAHARFNNLSSDALTASYALQMFELAENRMEFCRRNLLHFKTMDEMSKLRKQLLWLIFHQGGSDGEFSWIHGNAEDVESAWVTSSRRHPLLTIEEEFLGQAICAGWPDRVAKRIGTVSELSDKDRKVKAVRYQSSTLKETVFLHHSSSVAQSAPEFLVYKELLCNGTKRPYMHGVTSVKSDWLVKYASHFCKFSASLTDPKPYYEPLTDQVRSWVSPTFVDRWQLPLHSLPIKEDMLRMSVFACALLEGNVLPCLRSVQKFLVAPPSSILRPEASGQRRVCNLLNKLKSRVRIIDSRAILREAWNENPWLLHSEIQCWLQEKFHDCFEELWQRMHNEVLFEPRELFPKRARKEKKRNKLVED
uniref:RNA helicase n=1 Tax=Anthurium amnicola TaxID=1678845 RepID=A0A1D1ZFG7_9ARAE